MWSGDTYWSVQVGVVYYILAHNSKCLQAILINLGGDVISWIHRQSFIQSQWKGEGGTNGITFFVRVIIKMLQASSHDETWNKHVHGFFLKKKKKNNIQLAETTLLISVKPEIGLLLLTALILGQTELLPSAVHKKGLNLRITACGYVGICLDMLVCSLQTLYVIVLPWQFCFTLNLWLKDYMLQLAADMVLSLHQFSGKCCHTPWHTSHLVTLQCLATLPNWKTAPINRPTAVLVCHPDDE